MPRHLDAICVRKLVTLALCVSILACGGTSPPPPPNHGTPSKRPTEPRQPHQPSDGLQLQGNLGTISPEQVNRTLESRVSSFARCFEAGQGLDILSGEIRLAFRIRVDGSVAWVYPIHSTIGHRGIERCIVDLASRVQFPRPRGGEAEFNWSFAYDAPSDVRPPLAWDAARLGALPLAEGSALLGRCGGARGSYKVTAYIEPGGRVLAVGASASSPEAASRLDCITEGIKGWRMPDPGSYPAKVSFLL
ncbi:MAG: AgmX/PglI C-terminal domain-containing protein [Sandaracinaceae bacterium]|nr:AgmX/PglI C-terminal domain-containing protein [Sandaracinaceae bacterium]